jgi:Protein of unknown function (DUF1553)/Protein of unknown function (DUF1549)/Planctomycete cytochrome C
MLIIASMSRLARAVSKRSGRFLSAGFMALSLIGLASQQPPVNPPPTPAQITFFETKIRPILADKCQTCHGKSTQMGNLRLDSLDALKKGGDSGSAIIPGQPDKSLLIAAVRQTSSLKMPQGGKLTDEQVADLTQWVQIGAPWPDSSSAELDPKANLWSLKPVVLPAVPKVKNKAWVHDGIDAFVVAQMESKGLAPAAPADRRTLIRRATYDLVGLPPSDAEVQAFLQDKSPDAYAKVVDRLLASPEYGEHWARHWMDVARYSDTKGYVFNEDRNYPNAYTYRNWLIDAFNKDLPYNKFIEEQLAADLMPEVKDSEDKKPLAAMGFLTVGRRFLNSEPDIIDDRIDVTMRGMEGFTVGCARCHDHKFDPIPTQDYYSLYAVFASSEERAQPISEPSITRPWEDYNNRVESAQKQMSDIVSEQVKLLRDRNKTQDLGPDVKGILQAVREEDSPNNEQLNKILNAFDPEAKAKYISLRDSLTQIQKSPPPTPELAMAMQDSAHPHDGVIFKRGNPNLHGDQAPRRFLQALCKAGEERPHWTDGSGRLELAEAIASKENPLTARVFVNRVWLQYFGAGIVRTPSDFGHQGDPPTDPKLLDYLASTFMNDGWSIKKLQRLIVMSSTYRQSSDVSPKSFAADPDNRLWTRMNRRRLDLEEMRDSIMDACGQLDKSTLGGKSVDLWSEPFTKRRAVYGFIERQNLPGVFRTFDYATPDATSPKRFTTTVPQQALFFMNSPFAVDAARGVANRPEIHDATDEAQQIRRLYLLLFDRLPTADEAALGKAYLGANPGGTVPQPGSVWSYGYGGYDEAAKQTRGFTSFAVFEGGKYHPQTAFPDPTFGYVTLNETGGHPGRDQDHATIRRWTSPITGIVSLDGMLHHGQKEGDGVRARIVSSRLGLVGQWLAHNSQARTNLTSVAVKKGDTIDFMVDPMLNDGFDSFAWAPTIQSADGSQTWGAQADFHGPPDAPMTRLALYAQALMMTNEFLFID